MRGGVLVLPGCTHHTRPPVRTRVACIAHAVGALVGAWGGVGIRCTVFAICGSTHILVRSCPTGVARRMAISKVPDITITVNRRRARGGGRGVTVTGCTGRRSCCGLVFARLTGVTAGPSVAQRTHTVVGRITCCRRVECHASTARACGVSLGIFVFTRRTSRTPTTVRARVPHITRTISHHRCPLRRVRIVRALCDRRRRCAIIPSSRHTVLNCIAPGR